MPSTADTTVSALYNWLGRHAADGIDFYPDAVREDEGSEYLSREQVLDRYNQHTKHCKICTVQRWSPALPCS